MVDMLSATREPSEELLRDASGVVMAAQPGSRTPQQVVEAALAVLKSQLDQMMVRSVAGGGPAVRLGSSARYELVAAGAGNTIWRITVRVGPGPHAEWLVQADGEGLPASIARRLDPALAAYGLAQSGSQRWSKVVAVNPALDTDSLARDLLALLTGPLAYDGRSDLRGDFRLEQRIHREPILDRLTLVDLGELLNASGFAVQPLGPDSPRTYCSTGPYPFLATVQADDDEHPGEYSGFKLEVFIALPPEVREGVEADLRRSLPFARVWVDAESDLVVAQIIYLAGGVTLEHVQRLLGFWHATLEVTAETLRQNRPKMDAKQLN